MLEIIHHVLPEAFFDVLKTVPLLLVVYALLYYIENRLTNTPELLSRAAQFGPVVGALAGSIPQCGFSAAASALFSAGFLAPATLVAVFLATSDEAVPIMLAGGASVQQVVLLLVVKFAIAVIGGYVLRCTVFRRHKAGTDGPLEIEMGDCGCETSPVANILSHTIKTTIFLFVVLFALNMVVHGIGEERVASLMLTNSIFQPLLCAVLGLIPSCAMSVLLSELFVGGTISFGALVAGLSTGAGFGYIVLLEGRPSSRPAGHRRNVCHRRDRRYAGAAAYRLRMKKSKDVSKRHILFYALICVFRSPRRVTHLQTCNRRGEHCSAAARPESAQGTAGNRLIWHCVGAHCAPLRERLCKPDTNGGLRSVCPAEKVNRQPISCSSSSA